MLWIARLNAADAAAVWDKARPFLENAIQRADGLYEPEDVRRLVTGPRSGTADGWSLWIVADKDRLLGAWTTNPHYYPRERVLHTMFGGGVERKRWWDMAIAEMDKFARESGIKRLRCGGRRGWARCGYTQVGYLHERIVA